MKSCQNVSFDDLKRFIEENMVSKWRATQARHSKEYILEIVGYLNEKPNSIEMGFMNKK